ncbi:AraC family transcriptional activator of pobA [Pedobacter sp. UYP30]|uniref:helix-turn-helix domain-containing protein n=1 Tax=Pedobacter sp. UYP30 TaxID=1756400 RepID=UPI003398BF37
MKSQYSPIQVTFQEQPKQFLFNVDTLERAREPFGLINSMQCCSDYFEIVWITKGCGTFYVDSQNFNFNENNVFCVKGGKSYHFKSQQNIFGYKISFAEKFLNFGEFDLAFQNNLFQIFSKLDGVLLMSNTLGDMREIVEKMINEFNNSYLFKNEVLNRYLKIFLIYLTRQLGQQHFPVQQTRNIELFQNFSRLVEHKFREQKTVERYAQELYISPNYLNEIVKKTTGSSASNHIRRRVVNEAKKLALTSDRNMKEIAYYLGFVDTGHFSKFFKSTSGRNFSEFKKERTTILVAS